MLKYTDKFQRWSFSIEHMEHISTQLRGVFQSIQHENQFHFFSPQIRSMADSSLFCFRPDVTIQLCMIISLIPILRKVTAGRRRQGHAEKKSQGQGGGGGDPRVGRRGLDRWSR
jgi:hypothetical protein